MIIAIDFDGSVVEHKYPFIGRDVPHAVRVMKRMINAGHQLILYTMRSGYELGEAIDWFKEKKIPLYGIQYNPSQHSWSQSNKCFAHVYIDDSALGCPLIRPEGFARSCVDWLKVEDLIFGVNPPVATVSTTDL